MSDINYYNIQRSIERNTCPEHGKHPKFSKTINGFSITACCENFRASLVKKAENAVAEETKKAIEKIFKDAFR